MRGDSLIILLIGGAILAWNGMGWEAFAAIFIGGTIGIAINHFIFKRPLGIYWGDEE